MEFSFEEIYRKMKSYIYYDKYFLFLRNQLIEFEAEKDFLSKLKNLENKIINKDFNFFRELISQISYFTMIKNIDEDCENELIKDNICNASTVISSDFEKDKYKLNLNYFINMPIELHILSTFWIVNEGYLLESDISDNCYGNRLEINKNKKVKSGIKLFKKYFEQYELWRDNSLAKAEKMIEEGNDIVILTMDISKYYYNAHIDFDEIIDNIKAKTGKNQRDEINEFALQILKEICVKYTKVMNTKLKKILKKDKIDNTILPIGFIPSNIFANWILNEFDKNIEFKMQPYYYGRYVDDIIIVFKSPLSLNNKMPEREKTKYIIENYLEKYHRIVRKNGEDDFYEINITSKKMFLKVQSKKFKFFYLKTGGSKVFLEIFRENLRKNSSEMRMLPEEKEDFTKFNKEVYSILYGDSINKIRSIDGIKEDKYKLIVYLMKILQYNRYIENNEKIDQEIINSITTFFNERNCLEYFQLWEKVFTFFVMKKRKREIARIKSEIENGINKIFINNERISYKEAEDIREYLNLCIAMAFSLTPELLDKEDIEENKILKKIYDIRKTNMIRHYYVNTPLGNYTDEILNQEKNISVLNFISRITINNKNLINFSPRFVHFDECCTFFIIKSFEEYNGEEYENNYFDKSLELYKKLNHLSENDEGYLKLKEIFQENNSKKTINKNLKVYMEKNKLNISDEKYEEIEKIIGENKDEIIKNIFKIPNSTKNRDTMQKDIRNKIKIGIANIRLEEEDIKNNLINRKKYIFERESNIHKILNLGRNEKADIIVLPELSVPVSWLPKLSKFSRENDIAIIFGLEHFITVPENYAINCIVSIFPYNVYGKSAIVKTRIKNYYAPEEEELLKGYSYKIPKTEKIYDLFIWKNINISCYNCFELASAEDRNIFKSEIDLLIASIWNRDVNYYSNIAELTSRDLHCYYVQVNTSIYGDSRIVKPSSTETKDIAKIKGGTNATIIIEEVDIEALRKFQIKEYNLQMQDKTFKVTPPGFDRNKIKERGNYFVREPNI